MYESMFQLQRRPFSATPDPSCVFLSPDIQTLVDELVVCLERGEGIAVLTAPAGLGKTLICERVRQEFLNPNYVCLLLRHSQFLTPADLLRTLLTELGGIIGRTATEQELRLELLAQLTELRRQKQLLILLCDEAHELKEPLLDELRRLVDHADHGVPWVRILLAGQLELEEKLAEPQFAALNQRLRSHVTLSPLTTQESWDYLDYRITWAGGRAEEIFDIDALAAIVDAADGVPRCLNQLCDHALLLSYVSDRKPVTTDLVAEALQDLQHLPLAWKIRSKPASNPLVGMETSPVEHRDTISELSTVEFGDHLEDWRAAPTLGDSTPASELEDSEVWEFGGEDDAAEFAESESDQEPVSQSGILGPLDDFLNTVEAEVSRIEIAREAALADTTSVIEEPVLDRYAAIDAGWPTDGIPRKAPMRWSDPEPLVMPGDTQILHRADVAAILPPPPAAQSEQKRTVEEQVSAEVIELVGETQTAITGRRFDEPPQPPVAEATSFESAPPPSAASRPFRDLFTRLRRKQKGWD